MNHLLLWTQVLPFWLQAATHAGGQPHHLNQRARWALKGDPQGLALEFWVNFQLSYSQGLIFSGKAERLAFLTLGVSKLGSSACSVVMGVSNFEGLLWRKYTGS